MRRLIICAALVLCCLGVRAQDAVKNYAVLDSLLSNYMASIVTESVEVKKGECDFLLGSVSDKGMKQHMAQTLFDYFKEAPVMGDEEVAIYLYDKWFATGELSFDGEFTALEAEMFVGLNRNTMLGMDAPVLLARKPCLGKVSVPAKGVSSIMWFYDTACSKCRAEAELLPGVLEKSVDFPVTLVAFYTGSDRKAWREFRRSFKVNNPRVKMVHCWDPSYASDYQRLYAVISTPRMYMVAPEGSIIGRRLELESLQQLLPTAKEIDGIFSTR